MSTTVSCKCWRCERMYADVYLFKMIQVIESIATSLRKNDPDLGAKLENLVQIKDVSKKENVEQSETENEMAPKPLVNADNTELRSTGETRLKNQRKDVENDRSECVDEQVDGNDLVITEPNLNKTQDRYVVCSDGGAKDDAIGEEKCPDCAECLIQRPDPTPAELTMCLHAAVYKVRSGVFVSSG